MIISEISPIALQVEFLHLTVLLADHDLYHNYHDN